MIDMGIFRERDDFCKGCPYLIEAGVMCIDCPFEDNEDEAIDNQGDIDDDFNERSEGIEKFGGRPMTG